jgi:hypothetical protein
MVALVLRARAAWRRRWASLLALTFLVALVGSVVLTAFAGARRTAGVVDRFKAATQGGNVGIDLHGRGPDAVDDLEQLPEVSRVGRLAFVTALPAEGPFLPIMASIDGVTGFELERGLLIDGRRPELDEPLEIALTESHAHALGAKVGDRIPYLSWTPAQAARCFTTSVEAEGCEAVYTDPQGPEFTMDVVGIVRNGDDVLDRAEDSSTSFATPAFYERYGTQVGTHLSVYVKPKEGTSVETLVDAALAVLGEDEEVTFIADEGSSLRDTVRVVAIALSVFGAVMLAAGTVIVVQAVVRQVQLRRDEARTTHALGMSRWNRALDLAAPIVPVAVTGAIAAAICAYAASRWLPYGTAREAEPDLGMQFDPLVLGGGALLIAFTVTMLATATGWWIATRPVSAARGRRRATASRLAPVGRRLPLVLGTRMAFDRGRGRAAVPVRSAVLACVVGIAGVVGVAGYARALGHLQHSPPLYGVPWDAAGFDPDAAPELLADDDLTAVAHLWERIPVRVDDTPAPAFVIKPLRGRIEPSIVAGRAPEGPGEVAVGSDTLERVAADIGDRVVVAGPDGQLEMQVVGTAVFPESDQVIELAHGVLIGAAALEELGTGTSDVLEHVGVRIDPGADRDAVLARLGELNPDGIEVPDPPPGVQRLAQVDDLPTALAVVLAAMAVLGVAHALGLCVRRRERDLALLRALGFRARDVRASVDWEALAMAVAGVVLGVPLGLLIGRLAWNATADSLGVRAVHQIPSATWLVIPAAMLLALAIAVVPAARATRDRPANGLRAE